MVELTRGNLLSADVDALVNTVNTVGVMGKGIALQFRKAFPQVYEVYKRACDAGEVQPGRMLVTQTGQVSGPRLVINFPTKRHWRGRSRLEDIDSGLQDLVRVLRDWNVRSVAVPPLGCGNGGLDWDVVHPRITAALRDLPDTHVLLFEPAGAPSPLQQLNRTESPRMTAGRAALLTVLASYQTDPSVRVTRLVVQKLAYLLQANGEPLRLRFDRGPYGPYADAINHVLQRMDGHFLQGYGDRTTTSDIRLMPDAVQNAQAFLTDRDDTRERINHVAALIDGFESPFGLELLTTVHWAAAETSDIDTPERAATAMAGWTERKRRTFDDRHVRAAWDRLADGGWLSGSRGASAATPSPH
jgi:O-acetyl-ADP-ribose deacetylase (regulator of RNase III)/uncharacterized protein YwgA